MSLPRSKDLWGHPKGLFILFLTEMWERFSYYGMRSLLVYYMVKQLMFNHGFASQVYGLYTGLVYLSPCVGGLIADRFLGRRKAVIVGALLMAIGHFMMAIESFFFVALLILILGNGFFKPNLSTQVADLYNPMDQRLDRAFSIFYVGINLGAFFSPLVCGSLGELYGWHYGFNAAGAGMIVGLLIYLFGQKWLAPDLLVIHTLAEKEKNQIQTRQERKKLFALFAIGVVSVAFWSAYEQQGNTLALWADACTDRHILGWQLPATWFQALNPAFILMLTPIVTTFWAWQSRNREEPSAILKMAIGCFLLAAGFLIMVPAARSYGVDGSRVGMSWLISFNLIATLGELYIAPVGLSLVTQMSPKRIVSMMMGLWFLSFFAGNYAAGFLGEYWDEMNKENFFIMIATIAFTAGLAMIIILKFLKRGMGRECVLSNPIDLQR
ncbi:MAG: peptide MFS transporter [Deltaproteobacteria bacterium]|nr:peptide MFS transporter [Deltaproteobacteria bacterium]